MEKFDWSSKKKNQPKRSVELIALAVRNISAPSEGMYCKVIYGDKRKKTRTLAKGDVADWKERLSLSTYSSGSLTIECWRRKHLGTSKKLGKLSFSQSELNECPEGRVQGWFSLVSRNSSYHSTGRVYVNLVIAGSTSEVNTAIVPLTTVQSVNRIVEPKNRTTAFGVVDRLFELRPELKNAVVEEGLVPNEFCQKLADIEKIITIVDNHLKALEHKMTIPSRRGTNLFLKQEIERMMQELGEVLAIGTKRLRQMGGDLNAVKDVDLQQKMRSFNEMLCKLMSRIDEYNKVSQEFHKREGASV